MKRGIKLIVFSETVRGYEQGAKGHMNIQRKPLPPKEKKNPWHFVAHTYMGMKLLRAKLQADETEGETRREGIFVIGSNP